MSESSEEGTHRALVWANQKMADVVADLEKCHVDVPDDGPTAREVRDRKQRRREDIWPMWLHTIGDIIEFAMLLPAILFLLAWVWFERKLSDR